MVWTCMYMSSYDLIVSQGGFDCDRNRCYSVRPVVWSGGVGKGSVVDGMKGISMLSALVTPFGCMLVWPAVELACLSACFCLSLALLRGPLSSFFRSLTSLLVFIGATVLCCRSPSGCNSNGTLWSTHSGKNDFANGFKHDF